MTHFIYDLGANAAVSSITANHLASNTEKTLVKYFSQISPEALSQENSLSLFGFSVPKYTTPPALKNSPLMIELADSLSSLIKSLAHADTMISGNDHIERSPKPRSLLTLTTPESSEGIEEYVSEQLVRMLKEGIDGIVDDVLLIKVHYQEQLAWVANNNSNVSEVVDCCSGQIERYACALIRKIVMHFFIEKSGMGNYYPNPNLIDESEIKSLARDFSDRFTSKFGFNIKPSKLLDIYSQCIGFENGYQQLKTYLVKSSNKVMFPAHTRENIKRDSWHVCEIFDCEDSGAASYTLNEVKECMGVVLNEERSFSAADLKKASELFSEHIAKLVLGSLAGIPPAWTVKPTSSSYFNRSTGRVFETVQRVFVMLTRALGLFMKKPKEIKSARISDDELSAYDDLVREFCLSKGWDAGAVLDVLEGGFFIDGFEFAMELRDEHRWQVTRETPDDLDDLIHLIEVRLSVLNWIWVECNPQLLTLGVGDVVERGVIKGVCDYRPGYYLVQEPEKPKTSSLLITFEVAAN